MPRLVTNRAWLRPLLSALVLGAGAAPHALAGEPASTLNPAVAEARWDDYRGMYPTSALCEAGEVALWTCELPAKTYSLCASRDISAEAGYIQYRAGRGDEVSFRFPGQRRHPRGIFSQGASPSGDADVTFRNGDYSYTLVDRMRGHSSIVVAKAPGDVVIADIACGNASQSLQLNYTIKLMEASGVADR